MRRGDASRDDYDYGASHSFLFNGIRFPIQLMTVSYSTGSAVLDVRRGDARRDDYDYGFLFNGTRFPIQLITVSYSTGAAVLDVRRGDASRDLQPPLAPHLEICL